MYPRRGGVPPRMKPQMDPRAMPPVGMSGPPQVGPGTFPPGKGPRPMVPPSPPGGFPGGGDPRAMPPQGGGGMMARMMQQAQAQRGAMPGGGRMDPRGVPVPRGMPPDAGGPGPRGGPQMPPNMRGMLQKMRMSNRPRRGFSGPAGAGGPPNRVGMADQQGGLARALQKGTGRPPMSRRSSSFQ